MFNFNFKSRNLKTLTLIFVLTLFILNNIIIVTKASVNSRIEPIITTEVKEDYVVYTINLFNKSNEVAKDVLVTSPIPNGLEFVNSSNNKVLKDDDKLTCELGDIEGYKHITYVITMQDKSGLLKEHKDINSINIKVETNDLSISPSNPTGEYLGLIGLIATISLCCLLIIKNKRSSRTLSIILVLIYITSLITIVNSNKKRESSSWEHKLIIENSEFITKLNLTNVVKLEPIVGLRATIIGQAIKLNWNSPNDKSESYTVKRGTDESKLETLIDGVTKSEFIDNDLEEDKYYFYKIIVKRGNQEYSSNIIKSKILKDSDLDGLSDEEESLYKTDINNKDTDGDELLDGEEVSIYGTDPKNKDTDNDRLTDFEEVKLTGTNPTKKDTNDNEISDDLEDLDKDGLNNYEEIKIGSNPLLEDTDMDGLKDGEEININSSATNSDTDGDEISDSKELELGLNPLKKDSNDNGILDSDEKFDVAKTAEKIEVDNKVKPTVNLNLKGKQIESLSITKIDSKDLLIGSQVPGIIGSAYDFRVDENIISGMLTFEFDKSLLGGNDFEPRIYYFNEKTQLLEELQNQVVTDNKVTAKLEHFSKYVLINKKEYEKTINNSMKINSIDNRVEEKVNQFNNENDSKGKASNDVGFIINNRDFMYTQENDGIANKITKSLVDNMRDENKDTAFLVSFGYSADTVKVIIDKTNNKGDLKAGSDNLAKDISEMIIGKSVGVAIKDALILGLDKVTNINDDKLKNKNLIIISDTVTSIGDGEVYNPIIEKCKKNNVKINAVRLITTESEKYKVDKELLSELARLTNGKYLEINKGLGTDKAISELSSSVLGYENDLVQEKEKIELKEDIESDKDKDGLSDYYEKMINEGVIKSGTGISLENKLDPNKRDTDGDDLSDGEEIEIKEDNGRLYYYMKSDPTLENTDGDEFNDKQDKNPLKYDITDRTLAVVAGLSYRNLKGYEGSKIEDLKMSGVLNKEDRVDFNSSALLGNWRILYSNESKNSPFEISTDFGLGSLAITREINGERVILLGYRGTEKMSLNDWNCDAIGALSKITTQSSFAVFDYYSLCRTYESSNIYITGHSLGGRLVQDVISTIYNPLTRTIKKRDTDKFKNAATFNALGYNMYDFINKTQLNLELIDRNKLRNYSYKYDLVGEYLGNSKVFMRIGTQIEPWDAVGLNGGLILSIYNKICSPSAVHGIDLWVDDFELQHNKVTIIN